jgi:adenosylcobinamide kinase/adenosylcobinamide-phosphate guanylyltransferase
MEKDNGRAAGRIVLILGGARSGKSSYAEDMAKKLSEKVLYVATALITDEDMADRIRKHRESRPESWPTAERYKQFELLAEESTFKASEVILLDCLTLMMTNLMFDTEIDYEQATPELIEGIEARIKKEIDALIEVASQSQKTLLIVSNEVGLGLVPSYKLGNYFRDISGRMNQYVAHIADEAVFMVSGLPIKLK